MGAVDGYIEQFPSDVQDHLYELRALVTRLVPTAIESISYGLIGYKLHGKPLVYFGGFAKHVGLYATPNGHAAFTQELSGYKQGKGSVQLPLDQPLPIGLIKKIVQFREQQINGGE